MSRGQRYVVPFKEILPAIVMLLCIESCAIGGMMGLGAVGGAANALSGNPPDATRLPVSRHYTISTPNGFMFCTETTYPNLGTTSVDCY